MRVKLLLLLTLCLGLLMMIQWKSDQTNRFVSFATMKNDQIREVNGLQMTLNDVYVKEMNEEEMTVIIDLTLINVSKTIRDFSKYKVTLMDEQGYAYDHESSIETKGILGGQLHPNRKNRGEIAFVVPHGNSYELVYTDHLRTGQVTWDITIEKE